MQRCVIISIRRFKIDLYNYVQAKKRKGKKEHNKKSFNAYLVDKDDVRKRQQKKRLIMVMA